MRKTSVPTSSRYKGVYWNKRDECWQAYITKDGVRRFLGYFDSEKDAAMAYNRAAFALFGEFSLLNAA